MTVFQIYAVVYVLGFLLRTRLICAYRAFKDPDIFSRCDEYLYQMQWAQHRLGTAREHIRLTEGSLSDTLREVLTATTLYTAHKAAAEALGEEVPR